MQSSRWCHGCFTSEKHFDTSGKSAALFHHRAISKTAHWAGQDHGQLRAILRRHRKWLAGSSEQIATRAMPNVSNMS
jgi:hypothetical protein